MSPEAHLIENII